MCVRVFRCLRLICCQAVVRQGDRGISKSTQQLAAKLEVERSLDRKHAFVFVFCVTCGCVLHARVSRAMRPNAVLF